MAIVYKTLFEIKILHEYFLTGQDGVSIFEKVSQQDRLNYLQTEFENDHSPINSDLDFHFPPGLERKYASYGLRVLPSYSGCRVVINVRSKKLADQTTVYEPFVPLVADLDLFIFIRSKNPAIENYTNSRINRALPAIYLFSSGEINGPRTFPFLTNLISTQNASFLYEQGELSLSGANVQEYFRQSGVDKWNNVPGSGFVNENDRLLLPEKFEYFINNTTNLSEVNFKLKDKNGNEVSNTTIVASEGIRPRTTLNFTDKVKGLPVLNATELNQLVYTLDVNGNNGYSASHSIIFSQSFVEAAPWAVIAIRPVVSNNAFNLFHTDGFIITRKDPFGSWTPAPVFEIPVKSRLAYWRYINNKGHELNLSMELTDYLTKEGKVLVTKKPRSLSRSWFFLRKEASTDTAYVPNPISGELQMEPDRRLFYDIMVPQSELFPEAP